MGRRRKALAFHFFLGGNGHDRIFREQCQERRKCDARSFESQLKYTRVVEVYKLVGTEMRVVGGFIDIYAFHLDDPIAFRVRRALRGKYCMGSLVMIWRLGPRLRSTGICIVTRLWFIRCWRGVQKFPTTTIPPILKLQT